MIKIYYRWCELDKKHEYGIVVPFYNQTTYWNCWLWYYIGVINKYSNKNPKLLPFASTWDINCKVVKVYSCNTDAEKAATRIINFINKHYSKKLNNEKIKSHV